MRIIIAAALILIAAPAYASQRCTPDPAPAPNEPTCARESQTVVAFSEELAAERDKAYAACLEKHGFCGDRRFVTEYKNIHADPTPIEQCQRRPVQAA